VTSDPDFKFTTFFEVGYPGQSYCSTLIVCVMIGVSTDIFLFFICFYLCTFFTFFYSFSFYLCTVCTIFIIIIIIIIGTVPNISNGTVFGDLDWPLNASSARLSASAELLVVNDLPSLQ